MAHFLEHMLFKGTHRRSPLDIAESLEVVGGEMNAFTSRENCCYYAKAISEHDELIFDVLSDLIFCSQFVPEEMEREKKVIFQEIDSYEDSPEELVHDLIVKQMYGRALGHPVIGDKKRVRGFTREQTMDFHRAMCQPSQMFMTVVGNIKASRVQELGSRYFSHDPGFHSSIQLNQSKETKKHGILCRVKPVEQCHLNLGWHAYSMVHKDRYILHLISSWLGGGMSSVLFQKIREQLGLAYNIYSYVRAYQDTGTIGIYSAHHESSTNPVLEQVWETLDQLKTSGIDAHKLLQLKNQLKGSLLLGLERTSFRMNRIAVGHLYFQKIFTAEELIDMVNAAENDDIIRVAQQIFSKPPTMIQVGPMPESEFENRIRMTRLFNEN